MKNKKIIVLLVLLLVSPLFCLSITDTSKEIHSSISNLKIEIKDLKSSLDKMEILSNQQLSDIQKLQQEKLELNTALDDTISKLDEYSTKIVELELKLKRALKVVEVLSIILGVMILIKIVVLILKAKLHITLPYWLNCLL